MVTIISILDIASKRLTPVFAAISGITSLMWERNFSSLFLSRFPQRTGMYEILSNYIPLICVSSAVLAAVCSLLGYFTAKTVSQLVKELEEEKSKISIVAENIEAVFSGILLRTSERIGFKGDESSRITIYIHNKNGHFISFGRYSPDPNYSDKGRHLLPDSEGCVSEAWAHDWCYEGNANHKINVNKYRMSRDTCHAIRMKSKCYVAKRIRRHSRDSLAVIVVESITADRFKEAEIKATLEDQESWLAEMVDGFRNHIVDPQNAQRRGF